MGVTGAPARSLIGVLLGLSLAVAACGTNAPADKAGKASERASASAKASEKAVEGAPDELKSVAMSTPGPLQRPILSPDLLVFSSKTLRPDVVAAISKVKGVANVEQISMAQFFVEEQGVTYAAVNPSTFRRFAPNATAQFQDVWNRVAGGEIAIDPVIGKRLVSKNEYISLGNAKGAPSVHVGAYAQLPKRIDAVVNERWAKKLGMPPGNAVLVSTGQAAPGPVSAQLTKLAGKTASVQILAYNFDVKSVQTAVLTGGSVARAVGSFNYTVNPNGTVNPDPRWVAANIRTEQVPILGAVRCHKAMLPQLRAALTEIERYPGLAKAIHKGEYGGCYVPRFIARNPARGLSFHTFGTALDINVPGNLRGTPGLIDRRVVAIFKKWGFNWGGDWSYTDPMHFELARIVKVG